MPRIVPHEKGHLASCAPQPTTPTPGLIHLAVHFGINPYLAAALAAPAVVCVSWLVNRHVIFRNAPRAEAALP